jgi:hypothetical protein
MKSIEVKFGIGDPFCDAQEARVGKLVDHKVVAIYITPRDVAEGKTKVDIGYQVACGKTFWEDEAFTIEEAIESAKLYHERKIQKLEELSKLLKTEAD